MTSPTTEQHTSGLGNSLDSRWGSCDRLDSLNHSHSWGVGGGIRSGSMTSLGRVMTSGRSGDSACGDRREEEEDQGEYDDEMNVHDGSGDRILLTKAMGNKGSSSDNSNNNIGRSVGDGFGSSGNLRMSGADAGIVIIPQEHDDYTLYTEIGDVRHHDDQYYDDGDEFHA